MVDLEAIFARANAAVAGPWEDATGSTWVNGVRNVTEAFVRLPSDNVSVAADIIDPATCKPHQATARFIAYARTDVPAMATELHAAREKIAALEAEMKERDDRLRWLAEDPSHTVNVPIQRDGKTEHVTIGRRE